MWSLFGWNHREEPQDQRELRRYLRLEYGTFETAWFMERLAAERRSEDGESRARLERTPSTGKNVTVFQKRVVNRVTQ